MHLGQELDVIERSVLKNKLEFKIEKILKIVVKVKIQVLQILSLSP